MNGVSIAVGKADSKTSVMSDERIIYGSAADSQCWGFVWVGPVSVFRDKNMMLMSRQDKIHVKHRCMTTTRCGCRDEQPFTGCDDNIMKSW